MPTKCYIGETNIARNVKKMYIGFNNKARRIRKAYIGVNNIPKIFFNDPVKLAPPVNPTALSYPAICHDTASIGNYLLVVGGRGSNTSYRGGLSTVNVYSTTLTKSTKSLPTARYGMLGCSNNSYALFGGGVSGEDADTKYYEKVVGFNSSLTRNDNITDLPSTTDYVEAATRTPSYGIFSQNKRVIGYNDSLVQTIANTNLSYRPGFGNSGNIGNYAIFIASRYYKKS